MNSVHMVQCMSPFNSPFDVLCTAVWLALSIPPQPCAACHLSLQLLVLGFPLFSKVPRFDRMMQLHRFSWLLVSLLLLAWHAVVYKALLHQPLEPWTGRADLDVCAAQAAVQVSGQIGYAVRCTRKFP